MRIGVDARNLVNRPTGIARYFIDHCRILAEAGHELHLYLPSGMHDDVVMDFPAHIKSGRFRTMAARQFWAAAILPAWVGRDRPDVFWGPAHRLARIGEAGIARVVTIHDLVWYHAAATMPFIRWLGERTMMSAAIERANIVCVQSLATRSAVLERFPSCRDNIALVPPIVRSPDEFEPDDGVFERADISGDYLLFVGTAEPRKNLERLIAGFAAFCRLPGREVSLVIAGPSGWKMPPVEEIARRYDIERRVRITGFLDERGLAALYRKARCLVMPSLHEGFGLPIIEANRFGVPVVTSNLSSMPEVSGDASLLVDPYSEDDITRALHAIVNDDELHAKLAGKARANAARYSPGQSGKHMQAALKRAIDRAASRRGEHRGHGAGQGAG